ncbi:sugar transferase [Mycolicibacterium llatzerense]|uniref:sugar transferase n=1 Tax=Mycolicibacterium llatzerense TaxID=280871 RepID=UPI0021B54331|nr:sugar transferase [Mycolicibacterium llatzerense]MCT7365806.1 UDP-phosphate galactose phosphotransferase [Mycolicibacterium llatzerense]
MSTTTIATPQVTARHTPTSDTTTTPAEALPTPAIHSNRGRSRREQRHAKIARKLIFSDALVICCSVIFGQIARFATTAGHPVYVSWDSGPHIRYIAVSATLAVLWMGFLSLGSRSPKVVGRGLDEYVTLVAATLQLFGLIAISCTLFRLDISRGYLAIALPVGLTGLIITRWAWRRINAGRHRNGLDQSHLLVVGATSAAADIATEFAKDPWVGYQVVGFCTPMGPIHGKEVISVAGHDIPIVGSDEAILDAVQRTGVDTVALAATHHLSPVAIRRLMWELEEQGVDLMVAPGLIDIADQRLTSRPVAGMAVFEIAKPQYSQANSLIKRAFDVLFATIALIAIAPVMIVTAIAVKLTSAGPIFYKSERIGMDGVPFRMTKFRSMYQDADSRQAEMIAANGGNAMFFKMKNDPRITPVGKIIRKFSIDELPQFFNVLTGEMSVVGPRPQVRREVDTYDDLVSRRLTVKPGLTGLWQVSGRSDLEVEDAVRLDLSYVENWSLLQDILIITKTIRTVVAGDGAY